MTELEFKLLSSISYCSSLKPLDASRGRFRFHSVEQNMNETNMPKQLEITLEFKKDSARRFFDKGYNHNYPQL